VVQRADGAPLRSTTVSLPYDLSWMPGESAIGKAKIKNTAYLNARAGSRETTSFHRKAAAPRAHSSMTHGPPTGIGSPSGSSLPRSTRIGLTWLGESTTTTL